MSISRRTILSGLASVTCVGALPVAFPGFVGAQSYKPNVVRSDARSAEGEEMLKIYAQAVKTMKEAAEGSPFSWTFQWYTHWVNGSSNKLAELNRIYGDQPSKDRDLANLTWSTCQAHGGGMWLPNFLPWHRSYVMFFEDIIREVSGKPEFALPYWDYTTDAVMPEAFRKPNDPEFGALYVAERNNGVNDGQPIGQVGPGSFNLDSMLQADYMPAPEGVPPGFNSSLNGGLHGYVHVNVGNSRNMGSVPFAAQDPIFWMHHCNIDRIWAGWNAAGGKNPTDETWAADQVHIFVDAQGDQVRIRNGEVTDIAALGYSYESLPEPPAPVVLAQARTGGGDTSGQARPLAATQGRVRLGDGATSVSLQPTVSALSERLQTGAGRTGQRRYLVISDVETNVQPGVVYNVYATSANARAGDPESGTLVGTIQFFDALEGQLGSPEARQFVFDVSEVVSSATDPLTYQIVPAGNPDADAQPLIGSIRLMEK